MAFNLNYGFTPEQLEEFRAPPPSPTTGIETMADEVGMGDFTAEVTNPFNRTDFPKAINSLNLVNSFPSASFALKRPAILFKVTRFATIFDLTVSFPPWAASPSGIPLSDTLFPRFLP